MIGTILTLLWALGHLTGAFFAYHAASRAHTAQGAVAWAIALVTFPWFALPFYAVFGPPKAYLLTDDQEAVRARAFAPVLAELSAGHLAPPDTGREVFARLAPAPIVLSDRPALLIDGAAIFGAFFDIIANAEHSLAVGFYIIRDDGLGQRLKAALIERAREGVHVRVLYDNIGSRNTNARYWADLADAGVEVRAFDVRRALPRVLRMNFRNHRKILAADGRVAIIGGPNMADEYLGRSKWFDNWRDTAVRLTGPAASVAEASFVEDWLWTAGELPADPPTNPLRPQAEGTTPVLVLPTGPADRLPACPLALIHLISGATERLWIASPYFVPDLDIVSALKLAALRGVDVRILIPYAPDHTVVWLASFAYAEEVLRAGVKLYRYREGFMHQKVILADDRVAGIGTVNLDNRSLRQNFESTVFVFEATFAHEVAAMLEADFARSSFYDAAAHERRPRRVRLLAPIARLLGPLL